MKTENIGSFVLSTAILALVSIKCTFEGSSCLEGCTNWFKDEFLPPVFLSNVVVSLVNIQQKFYTSIHPFSIPTFS